MRQPPLSDDLSVLARRDALTASERRRLHMLLRASPTERYLHELGRDFDAVPTGAEGDDELIARIVDRASAPRAALGGARPRWPLVVAVAAGFFVSLGAAAVALPRWWVPPPAVPLTECTRCAEAAVSATTSRAPVVPRAGGSAVETAPAGAASLAEAAPTGSAPAVGRATSAKTEFARANALRKSGHTAAAMAAYRQLQAAYPRSPEAVLSHVLLGRILLRAGSAEAACAEFARYRAASPAGSLTEEALHGQASALRMGGRTAEERRVHQELVARFPSSIYARASSARLRELD